MSNQLPTKLSRLVDIASTLQYRMDILGERHKRMTSLGGDAVSSNEIEDILLLHNQARVDWLRAMLDVEEEARNAQQERVPEQLLPRHDMVG